MYVCCWCVCMCVFQSGTGEEQVGARRKEGRYRMYNTVLDACMFAQQPLV